jgi:hypothetical protein
LKIPLLKNCKKWKNKTSLTTTAQATTTPNASRMSSTATTRATTTTNISRTSSAATTTAVFLN